MRIIAGDVGGTKTLLQFVDRGAVVRSLGLDKKRAGSTQRWILAHLVGHAEIHQDVPESLVEQAVDFALNGS